VYVCVRACAYVCVRDLLPGSMTCQTPSGTDVCIKLQMQSKYAMVAYMWHTCGILRAHQSCSSLLLLQPTSYSRSCAAGQLPDARGHNKDVRMPNQDKVRAVPVRLVGLGPCQQLAVVSPAGPVPCAPAELGPSCPLLPLARLAAVSHVLPPALQFVWLQPLARIPDFQRRLADS